MEILSNNDLKEFANFMSLKTTNTIGIVETLLISNDDVNSANHKSLKLLHERLLSTQLSIQKLLKILNN